jgi:hypothetical protein
VNKVFRSVLTGVISVGMFSALSVSPANAIEDQNPATPISLTGTPAVGSVLELTKQTYTSFTEGNLWVTWFRCNSPISLSNKSSDIEALLNAKICTIISQSTSTTYTVVATDAGKHVTGAVYIYDVADPFTRKDGTSIAQSLEIPASTDGETTTDDGTTTGGGTTTAAPALPAQKLVKALPAKAKAGKSITIAAVTKSKVAVKVKVAGKGCKVAAVKDKKNKKKISSYKVTMGKPGTTCTVTVTAKATSKVAALKLVKKITAIK